MEIEQQVEEKEEEKEEAKTEKKPKTVQLFQKRRAKLVVDDEDD